MFERSDVHGSGTRQISHKTLEVLPTSLEGAHMFLICQHALYVRLL